MQSGRAGFKEQLNRQQQRIDDFLHTYYQQRQDEVGEYSPQLLQSMRYATFSGGKRFRSVLSLQAAGALGVAPLQALPFASAIELIHTYSLVHDDLPCMDDDDFRRGKPTTHRQFGEPLALLAGDALLTEAFLLISNKYISTPLIASKLVAELAQVSGASGMVGGQAMDMQLGREMDSNDTLLTMHKGKTAALISAGLTGAGVLARCEVKEMNRLREAGLALGLAFQIKDDLLDEGEDESFKSYVGRNGRAETEKSLQDWSDKCVDKIDNLNLERVLKEFLQYNLERHL